MWWDGGERQRCGTFIKHRNGAGGGIRGVVGNVEGAAKRITSLDDLGQLLHNGRWRSEQDLLAVCERRTETGTCTCID